VRHGWVACPRRAAGWNSLRKLRNPSLNQGDGTFCDGDFYPIGAPPVWIVAADLNGDGRPDLATADFDNQVSVLLNASP